MARLRRGWRDRCHGVPHAWCARVPARFDGRRSRVAAERAGVAASDAGGLVGSGGTGAAGRRGADCRAGDSRGAERRGAHCRAAICHGVARAEVLT